MSDRLRNERAKVLRMAQRDVILGGKVIGNTRKQPKRTKEQISQIRMFEMGRSIDDPDTSNETN